MEKQELYTNMRNALATASKCIGHNKAHWNYVKANQYRDQLNKLGENLPTYDLSSLFIDDNWYNEQIKLGEYNGNGTY